MTVEPQPAGPTFARSARVNGTCTTYERIYIYIYIKNIYIYMTKIFLNCTISVGLAPLANKYSENSDNSTDKGGSLRSPIIIESVDSISKDERGFPLTQYITNGRISRGGYTFTHFKHHHRVLRLISYSMSV